MRDIEQLVSTFQISSYNKSIADNLKNIGVILWKISIDGVSANNIQKPLAADACRKGFIAQSHPIRSPQINMYWSTVLSRAINVFHV